MKNIGKDRDILSEITNDYYYGTIEDNNDPQKLFRCKVRVDILHNSIPNEDLPWASLVMPIGLGGVSNLSSFSVPVIGSRVLVIFHHKDIYSPLIIGRLVSKEDRNTELLNNYPNCYGFKDTNSNFWNVDMIDNKLNIKFNGDKILEVTSTVTKTIGSDSTTNIGGNVNIGVTGNTNMTVGGNVTIAVSGNTSLTCDQNNITGNLTVSGIASVGALSVRGDAAGGVSQLNGTINNYADINNIGDISGTGEIISNSIVLDSHTHTCPADGGESSIPH